MQILPLIRSVASLDINRYYVLKKKKRRWSNPENCTQEAKYEGNFNTGWVWGYRGRDRMVVGFITTYAISFYHYKRCDIPFMSRCTRYNIIDKVCQWLSTGWWFSMASPVSSTNKTDRQDMNGILLKVALNTIKLTSNPTDWVCVKWY
jgi:hypothetical protein